MIPKKPAPDLIRGGNRFPACAKPVARFIIRLDASAGEGRSEKVILHARRVGRSVDEQFAPLNFGQQVHDRPAPAPANTPAFTGTDGEPYAKTGQSP
jgi:hypothetical protein